MIIKHRGFSPKIDPSAYLAPTAVVCGNAAIEKDSRIMYGAILDSEGSHIEIGKCVIICENAVIRATALPGKDYPVIIGNNTFVGPHATLLGCTIEPNSYIATGATVLHGSVIKSGSKEKSLLKARYIPVCKNNYIYLAGGRGKQQY